MDNDDWYARLGIHQSGNDVRPGLGSHSILDVDLDVILDVDVDAVRIVHVVQTYSMAARSLLMAPCVLFGCSQFERNLLIESKTLTT